MGADYETETERAENRRLGIPDVGWARQRHRGRDPRQECAHRPQCGDPAIMPASRIRSKSYVIRDGIVVILGTRWFLTDDYLIGE